MGKPFEAAPEHLGPSQQLECGRFYARALSSWSLLLAAQGFIYEGPRARIGFRSLAEVQPYSIAQ